MKIISLTMNAFMTYKEKTTIQFDEFIDHGLYLISGPTGAGKTTIFDAMTFALYGVASGSTRNQSYFRSDFADVKDETYVEMTFELHRKRYTIKRSPTYTRPGYKTAKMANAYLTYDQTTIEGVKEVNQKINQLLGVNVQQFKQIVMIAQGEFSKLIYASSEEREHVLRHIFHSEPLVQFENLLKEEAKKNKDQYLLSSQQLFSRFQLLSLPTEFMKQHSETFHPSYLEEASQENNHIYQESLQLKEQYEKSKYNYDVFSKDYYQKEKHNQDLLEYQRLQKEYDQLNLQEETINDLKKDIDKIKIIEQNQSFIYQHHQTTIDLKQVQEQYDQLIQKRKETSLLFQQIEKEYQLLPQQKENKDNLLIQIEKNKQAIQKQKEYLQIQKQHHSCDQNIEKLKREYQQYQQSHDKLVKRMERDQENVNHLAELQLDLQQKERIVKEVNEKRVAIHELSQLYDTLTELQDHHYDLSNQYKKIDALYQKTLQRYQLEDENFKCQQAGILAMRLKDNEPCPVCGSLHHPHLATLSSQVLSANELEALSLEVEQKKQQKEESYQEVLAQNQQIHTLKTQIDILKKQLHIEEELSKEVFIRLLSDVIHIIKDQEKTYQKQYDEVVYLKRIKKSLEQDNILSNQQTEELKVMSDQLNIYERQIAIYNSKLQEFESQYHFDESTDIQRQLNDNLLELKKQERYIQNIEETYHQCQKEISLLNHQKEEIEKQKATLMQNFQVLQQQFQQFINEHFVSLDEYQKYAQMIHQLSQKEQVYQDFMIKQRTLKSQLASLKKQTSGYQMSDLTVEREQLQALETIRDQNFKLYNECYHTYQQNQNILETLQKDYLKNQSIFENYIMYQDLSDMTSGKNGQRMSFERYVLATYFEHILEYANIELLKMSQGRFALYRKESIKGAKQQGLDLSVLDYETGMMRDIQTLSGGESFKAALSLALGLSSMIQTYAGGIELNTLFIDEGFGTLDSESIDQALSVLLDLQNDNKVIGIISHVDELKERIHTQIVVDKGMNGSHLHIEKE
jgi:exonuclease SbcC